MVSDKEFDYSWDDQDPDRMTDLVAGEYAPSPDIEDHPELENEHECSCGDEFNDVCLICGHALPCCRNSNCSLDKQVVECTCDDSATHKCDDCGHVPECQVSDCDSHNDMSADEAITTESAVSPPPRLTPSHSLVEALIQIRQLKSKIQELEVEEQALRDMILEATGGRESLLVDPKNPSNILAAILKKPFTWMRAGGQALIKRENPELYGQLYDTKLVTRLLLKNEPSKEV